jgi:hypothetical protein
MTAPISGSSTTGLGIPCYVAVSGANINPASNLTGGSSPLPVGGSSSGTPQGQGTGAISGRALASGGNAPVNQYSLTLSLSGKSVNGVSYHNECVAIASLVDVEDNAVSSTGYENSNFTWTALCAGLNPPGGWYRPNNATPTGMPSSAIAGSSQVTSPAYNPTVVTLGSAYGNYDADMVITANAVGHCIVEVAYPAFYNAEGQDYNAPYDEPPVPQQFIYAQINVSVIL